MTHTHTRVHEPDHPHHRDHDRLNRAARFLPQTSDDERPAVRVGDALVSVYWKPGPLLQVTIDTSDLADRFPHNPPLQVVVNNGVVYQTTSTPDDDVDGRGGEAVSGLDDRELFEQLALAEYADLHGGAGFDHPIDDLIGEVERRMPGAFERLDARFDHYDAGDVVRAWFTDPDTLLATARGRGAGAGRPAIH
ncbi:hypothetical protein [Pseudonocardia sp. NPDC049635]|uniref:hypothetical protein n=1 Tax=Pseudonocardia sp. NPDC049635 TaxID=3155506 RepID=UPI0033CC3AD4